MGCWCRSISLVEFLVILMLIPAAAPAPTSSSQGQVCSRRRCSFSLHYINNSVATRVGGGRGFFPQHSTQHTEFFHPPEREMKLFSPEENVVPTRASKSASISILCSDTKLLKTRWKTRFFALSQPKYNITDGCWFWRQLLYFWLAPARNVSFFFGSFLARKWY